MESRIGKLNKNYTDLGTFREICISVAIKLEMRRGKSANGEI